MNTKNIEIRKETEKDYLATEEMCMRAFWNLHSPGCDEHLLVRKLRKDEAYLPELSRIATVDGNVAATIMYSKSVIKDGETEHPVVTFGPLAVDPLYQNTGIGGKLLQYTMQLAREAGYAGIVITGEPKYYPKHGFVTADQFGFTDAEGNTFDAFMAYELVEGAFDGWKGKFFEAPVFEKLSAEEAAEMCKEFKPIVKGNLPCQWTYENASQEKEGYHLEPADHYWREFHKLFEEYIKEIAPYDAQAAEKNCNGYFTAVEKKPYVIFIGEKPVGIAVMSVADADAQEMGCGSFIDELFVEKASRSKGIAGDIVIRYLKQQEGSCGFTAAKRNETAVLILEKILQKGKVNFDKTDVDKDTWFYRIERIKK